MSEELIPLSKLVVSKANVRKTGAETDLGELKASIRAHGLLNPLTVRKGAKGKYEILAGQRRFLALSQIAFEDSAGDAAARCTIVSDKADGAEISLAENAVRTDMHPADQFQAFRDLIDKGSSIADVAARFGVSEATVAKRLKLGRIAPKLLDLYRKGEMKLEQVQALTLTDDHVVQIAAWEGSMGYQREPFNLRRALTNGEVEATDRRVQFVGLDAYEAAGGTIRRDLFDGKNAGYISDTALLDKLVTERLEGLAEMARAEKRFIDSSARACNRFAS